MVAREHGTMAASTAALLVLCCVTGLLHYTAGQTRILTGAEEEDPLKCYTADGLVGDCRPWRYCRIVRQEYPKKKPTICLYRPKNPVVCCPRKSSGGKFVTTRRPTTRRPTSNPWRPVSGPQPQQSGHGGTFNFGEQTPSSRPQSQGGKFNFGPKPQSSRPPSQGGQFNFGPKPQSRPESQTKPEPQRRPDQRPISFASSPSSSGGGGGSSERLHHRDYSGHKDCGLVTRTVRADFDQLELRRRRRRRSALDQGHAAPSATEDPFAIFDSQTYPEEEADVDYVPYTEAPPPAGSDSPGRFLHVKILPHEPDAASLVYGDAEDGYEPDFYDLPPAEFDQTFVIRTGKALNVDDPFGIDSKEYRDKISKQLKDVRFITAGQDAYVGQWPWIALIGERQPTRISWFCGGALLNEEYVVTAAHCLGKFQKNRLVVRVGEHDLKYDTDAAHQDLLVDRIILHPDYVHRRKHHDIALLHLSRRVRLGGHVRPVCLPPRAVDLTGQMTTVAGWGHTEFGGEKSAVLQEVQLPLVNTTECENTYRTLGEAFQSDFAPGFGDTKICAHDTTGGGRDSCQGDSGGPMTYRAPGSERIQLVGIVSSGVGCGHPKFPGVYTRVAMYADWLLERAFPKGR